MSLIDHPEGNYRFLPGIAPYSCGAVSVPGFEIVHAVLQRPLPYRAGFERIAGHLAAAGRPKAALCGVELRSPAPFSFPGFAAFNGEYAAILEGWGLLVNGINPVARTNVAPVVRPPGEPVLYGFSYTRPCAGAQPPTFVVAGAGELPEGILAAESIVAPGDTSPHGITTKAAFVMDLMERRLFGLGADWALVNAVDVYTVHSLDTILPELVLNRAGPAAVHGVRWHYSRPPITDIEFEMDLRGTRTELHLSTEPRVT
ncbi:MAG TPA: hypothetical protein VKE74_16995 [Gemmataceae bacterium]|nr:hypothetical protein [Gemmataceae bacterium]